MNKLRAILTTLAVAVGLLILAPTAPAQAAATVAGSSVCSGSLVDYQQMGTYHKLEVYWNSSTKKNCAVLLTSYGTKHEMTVSVQRCTETSPSAYCTPDSGSGAFSQDTGKYGEYAGPVTVTAGSKCIRVFAYATIGSQSWGADSGSMRGGKQAAFC
ncbi:hypothetical protein [Streptomyces sp. ITFR-16]|uniref:hypothetical protein n=1 Tax=Streptomyces sp. ITFR-16 TaxID=3075198 RepID=UPI00288A299E|nr:hypothetical protein [Streptomyces sp. ITFR-16]WNI24168.1 hypothetical protein RLT58_20655 [Streptomyces sp. ITFR-16]